MVVKLNTIKRLIQKILIIEANPSTCKKIKKDFKNDSAIKIVNAAITEYNSSIIFRLTSGDEQQSSVLKIKKYSDYYPSIREVKEIRVKSRTLDHIIMELNLCQEDFNFLNLNTQGVELSSLKGSIDLLKYIEAINTEFYMEELYENCCRLKEVDDFLFYQQFNLKTVSLKENNAWGNAFLYQKTSCLHVKPWE